MTASCRPAGTASCLPRAADRNRGGVERRRPKNMGADERARRGVGAETRVTKLWRGARPSPLGVGTQLDWASGPGQEPLPPRSPMALAPPGEANWALSARPTAVLEVRQEVSDGNPCDQSADVARRLSHQPGDRGEEWSARPVRVRPDLERREGGAAARGRHRGADAPGLGEP